MLAQYQTGNMAGEENNEYAGCCLEAAVDACKKRKPAQSLKEFNKFLKLLEQHKVCAPEFLEPTPIDSQIGGATKDKLPTDVIPLNLYALATCWRQNRHADRADHAVQQVVQVITQDKHLSFLRQNIFQEGARYYSESEQFELADDLLSRQLSIVKLKGSKVLLEYVTTNWLINKGNLHTSSGDFEQARSDYEEALALIESEWEPRLEQVDLLHRAWNKLEARLRGNG